MDYRVSCIEHQIKIARLTMGKRVSQHISCVFYWILFIFEGDKDMHTSKNEFEFQSNPITDYRVYCPWPSKNSISPHFLLDIDHILFKLQVTRTCIISWMSSNFSQILLMIKAICSIMSKQYLQETYNGVVFGILLKLAGNENDHWSLDGFEIQPDRTTD